MQTHSRIYDSYEQATKAVRDLERAGVPSGDISLVANQQARDAYSTDDDGSSTASGAGIGAVVGGGTGLLAGLGILAIPGIGPVVAAGWLAATALGAVVGSAAGGLVGALVETGVSEEDAHFYSEAVRRGGTLLTVRSSQPGDRILAILDGYDPVDPTTRRNEYTQSGWTKFDANAPMYRPDHSDGERNRRA